MYFVHFGEQKNKSQKHLHGYLKIQFSQKKRNSSQIQEVLTAKVTFTNNNPETLQYQNANSSQRLRNENYA